MDILVNIVNQKLKISTNQKLFTEGTQEFIRFVFNLPVDWKNLKIFAQFTQNGQGYNKYLDKYNSVYLPPEIQTGKCDLTIYGTRGNIIAISDSLEITINKAKFIRDSQNIEISEQSFVQLVSKMDSYETWEEF